jgi:hypothetical protein
MTQSGRRRSYEVCDPLFAVGARPAKRGSLTGECARSPQLIPL